MVIPGPYSDSVGERWATGIFSFFTNKPDNPDAGVNRRLAGLFKRSSSVMKTFYDTAARLNIRTWHN